MDFELNEDQRMLAQTVADFAKNESPFERFRSARLTPTRSSYYHIGGWLRNNTPPEATVGAIEVGVLDGFAVGDVQVGDVPVLGVTQDLEAVVASRGVDQMILALPLLALTTRNDEVTASKFTPTGEPMCEPRGSVTSTRTMPFLRFDAPSRERTHRRPSAETLTSFTVRASTSTVSMCFMLLGSVTSQK